MKPLLEAISIIGSQRELANVCGVVQSAVAGWFKRGSVPANYCWPIEKATGGKVTRRALRPDDWAQIWPELASAAPTQPEGAAHV
ncbi:transcriptional regulator [Rhodoferax sp. WC2427]|uniref:transcriptional regulator n=1 Tax=Rhodoferax sp. WC2427 TaxID=3234144 RepID=UPI003466ADFC